MRLPGERSQTDHVTGEAAGGGGSAGKSGGRAAVSQSNIQGDLTILTLTSPQHGQRQSDTADQQHEIPGQDGEMAALQVYRGVSWINIE